MHKRKCISWWWHLKSISFPCGVLNRPQLPSLHVSEILSQWIGQNPKGIWIFLSLINLVIEHLWVGCRRELHKKQVVLALSKPEALSLLEIWLLELISLWKVICFKVFEIWYLNFNRQSSLESIIQKSSNYIFSTCRVIRNFGPLPK